MGQFTVRCATDQEMRLDDEALMAARWDLLEEEIFSGVRVAASYEQYSGKPFPPTIKQQFVRAVDVISAAYRKAERLPGLATMQEAVGEGVRRGVGFGSSAIKWVRRRVSKGS